MTIFIFKNQILVEGYVKAFKTSNKTNWIDGFSKYRLPLKNSSIGPTSPHIQPYIIDTWPWRQDENQHSQTIINTQGSSSINSQKQGFTSGTIKIY